MSLLTWIREWASRRNQVALDIIDYTQYGHIVQFFLRLHNKSGLPAYVAKISISFDGAHWHDCELEPKKIALRPSGYAPMTPRLPLNLPPISFSAEYFEFLGCQEISLNPGTQVIFQIHTSRGNLKKSAKLAQPEHYLHNK